MIKAASSSSVLCDIVSQILGEKHRNITTSYIMGIINVNISQLITICQFCKPNRDIEYQCDMKNI